MLRLKSWPECCTSPEFRSQCIYVAHKAFFSRYIGSSLTQIHSEQIKSIRCTLTVVELSRLLAYWKVYKLYSRYLNKSPLKNGIIQVKFWYSDCPLFRCPVPSRMMIWIADTFCPLFKLWSEKLTIQLSATCPWSEYQTSPLFRSFLFLTK